MIGQDVRADSPAPRRSVITLAVVGALGRASPCRTLNGLTLAAARDVLRRAGLRVESERQNGALDHPRRRPRRRHRHPGAGKLVPPGAHDHAADGPPTGELT